MRRLFLLAAAGAGAAALYRQSHKRSVQKQEQVLDNTIDDSFPASDPPSYSVPVTVGGAKN